MSSTTISTFTSVSSSTGINLSNIAKLDNGTYYMAVTDYDPSIANYMNVYKSTNKGSSWSIAYKIYLANQQNILYQSYTSWVLTSKGNRLVCVGSVGSGTNMSVVGIDPTVIPDNGTTYASITAFIAAGGWYKTFAWGNNFNITNLIYGSDDYIYFVGGIAGSTSVNMLTWGATTLFNSTGMVTAGYSIIEYNGYVYVTTVNSYRLMYSKPIGSSTTWTSFGYTPLRDFTGFEKFLVHPNGYLYLVELSYNHDAIYIGRSADSGHTWEGLVSNTWSSANFMVATTTLGLPPTAGSVFLDKSGNIVVYVHNTTTRTTYKYVYTVSSSTPTITTIMTPTYSAPPQGMTSMIGNSYGRNQDYSFTYFNGPNGNNVVNLYLEEYNTAPSAPTPQTPVYGSAINTRTPNITWTYNDSDAGDTQSSVQIQISTDYTFTSVNYDTGKVAYTALGANPATLSADGNWYYRIRTWDNSDVVSPYNTVGSTQYFTVDTVIPSQPTLTIGTISATSVALSWTAFSDPAPSSGLNQALIYIRTWNGSAWTDISGSPKFLGSATSYTYTGLTQNTQYHVIAQWVDNAGNYSNYPELSFITDVTPPVSPTQSNGVLFATSNSVSWSAFSDGAVSSGLATTLIYLQSWNGSSYVNVSGFPKSISGTTYSFTGLTANTQYQWGVTYQDFNGNVSSLVYTAFVTNAYSTSTMTNLVNNTGTMYTLRPKFSFSVNDTNDLTLTNFQIQVSTASDFSSTTLDTTSSASASGWSATSIARASTVTYIPQSNLTIGTLYVRARSYDGKDWGTWTSSIQFSIGALSWATTLSTIDTAVSKRTVDEIRTKVNLVRQARGLSVAPWTDPTVTNWSGGTPTQVRTAHVIELRQAITDIYTALSVTAPTWTDIISTSIARKGLHWIELRGALAAI